MECKLMRRDGENRWVEGKTAKGEGEDGTVMEERDEKSGKEKRKRKSQRMGRK